MQNLGCQYLELAERSEKIDENDMMFDPIPWGQT